MFRKILLPNRLRVIMAPMKGTNTVTLLVMCSTGSDHEPRGKNGISHFLEHMFFKGTKKRPTPQRIMQEADTMGSITNAFTSHEYTGYFVKAGKTYLDQSLDLIADIYQNSLFPEREITREKQVVIEEMQNLRDTPSSQIWRFWEKLLYGDQPAGWEVGGDDTDIGNFTRKDLLRYFNSQYTSQNTIVALAGNFDEPRALARIERFFGGVRSGAPRPKAKFSEAEGKKKVFVQEKKTDQSHVILGYKSFPKLHPDRYTLDLLETIVGGSDSSRMFDVVREQNGLAYTIFTYSQAYSNRGYFATYAGVSHRNIEKAVRVMKKVYASVLKKPVAKKELDRAKDHFKGTTLIQLESSNAMASFLGEEEAEGGKPMTPDELFARIDAVSAEDIARVAGKILRPGGLRMAVIGPYHSEKKFIQLIEA